MLRRKFTFTGLAALLGALLAVPFALVMASPASAVNTCTTGQYPNRASSQSGLDVACLFDLGAAAANVGAVEIHDSINAAWHRGAARTVAVGVTAASANITFASGVLTAADVRRPISGTGIPGGAFIKTVGATTGTISQNATATSAATTLKKVEHTSARVLTDATVATTGNHLTSASACFTATDVNKSVSGGAFSSGAKITSVGAGGCATTAVVSPAPTAASTLDTITIGATTYAATTPFAPTYTGADTRQLKKTDGVTCAGSTLTGVAAGGTFQADDVALKATFINGTAVVAPLTAKINSVSTAGTTSAVLSAACPVTWSHVVIGEPGANSPTNLDHVVTFAATLNLNPALNKTSDDCAKNTYEGFELVGRYVNPGSYIAAGAPARSLAQVAFPTSVLTFAAYVTPSAPTDTQQTAKHYDFVFPSLPTGLAVCTVAAPVTTNKTAVALDFSASTPAGGNTITPTTNVLPTTAFLPTGAGNPSSPSGRSTDNRTGVFGQKVILKNSTGTVLNTLAPTGCTIVASTAAPTLVAGTGYGCGDG